MASPMMTLSPGHNHDSMRQYRSLFVVRDSHVLSRTCQPHVFQVFQQYVCVSYRQQHLKRTQSKRAADKYNFRLSEYIETLNDIERTGESELTE